MKPTVIVLYYFTISRYIATFVNAEYEDSFEVSKDGNSVSGLSRSKLLYMLGKYQEAIMDNLPRNKKRNVSFNAEFANNKYTRPFIFPEYYPMEWMSEHRARPFGIVGTYFLITQLSGVAIFLIWGLEILQRSKSSVDPHVGNIILGTRKVVSGFLNSFLDSKNGTTPLALISGLSVGLVCLILGVYINCDKNHKVLPQICYVIYVIFATIGHYTLPVLIILELYPSQIRGIVAEISLSNACVLIFSTNVCYPQLRDLLGFDNSIASFGVCTLLGCFYLYFCLAETKGLTLHQIEGYFNEIRPKLTSQKKKIMHNINRNMSYGASAKNTNCYILRSKIN